MNAQAYLDLQEKHREEMNNFPIAYAFNDKQLEEALVKLGVKSSKECVTVFGHGDIVKRENAPKFVAMLKRHTKEIQELMLSNEEIAEAAFLYELDNHEYAINWDGDEDVLSCFGWGYAELDELGLEDAYMRAVRKHMKHAEEWGMI